MDGIVEVEITEEIRQEAKARAEALGRLRHSITKGEGNLAGYVGEIIVARYLNAEHRDSYDYDLLHNGKRVEVKTKRTTEKPLPHYDCSISLYNVIQECDYYFFVRVLKDMSKGWLLGFDSPEAFFKKARYLRKGQVDGDNYFVVKGDCYNVSIEQLRRPNELL